MNRDRALPTLIRSLVKTWQPEISLVKRKRRNKSAKEINEGFCDDFANAVVEFLTERGNFEAIPVTDGWFTVEGEGSWRHAWVYYYGKHYDAEVPDGVDDWMKLPFFKRHEADPCTYGGNFPPIERLGTAASERVKLDKVASVIAKQKIVLRAPATPEGVVSWL